MTKFYETDSEARWWAGITGRIIIGVVLMLLIGGAISAVLAATGAFTSNTAGKLRATQRINSADNRIFAQENFQQKYADVQGFTAKIKQQKGVIAQDKTDPNASVSQDGQQSQLGFDQQVLNGLQQECITTAQDYNAAANKISQAKFLSADLPTSIDLVACG